MSSFDEEIKQDFLNEARELLSRTERCFLNLEKIKNDESILEEILRLAHNLKGSGSAVGFNDLSDFAHLLESLLLKLKKKELVVDCGIVSLLLACNDHLSQQVQGLQANPNACIKNIVLVNQIEVYLSGKSVPPSRQKDQELSSVEHLEGQIVNLTARSLDQAKEKQSPGICKSQKQDSESLSTQEHKKNAQSSDESIRVNLSRIDRLMNNVGELVILQAVMSQQKNNPPSSLQQNTVDQMDKIIREVQEISMSLRMVSMRQTFQKMQRIVRDTSQALGKQVIFEMEGEDTELDNILLQQMGDPLVHLVRNAVDHGLEPTDERLALGKSAEGHIKLSACQRGSHIVIEIRDDGRGLNSKKLISKAVETGLLQPGDRLSDQEAYQLIFAPGFSTKSEVTEISGRGVGLDVVQTHLECLKGDLEIETELGQGTCFRILLPLTLAIIDGMVIRLGDERFVVPVTQIQESFQPSTNDITYVAEAGELLSLRGSNLALHRLENLLGKSSSITAKLSASERIAIVGKDNHQRAFSILVDDILGQQQVVIKRLGGEIDGMSGISGAAILGDGKVSLILDLVELIQMRWKSSTSNSTALRYRKEAHELENSTSY